MGRVSGLKRKMSIAGTFIVFSYSAKHMSCPQHACYIYLLIWFESTQNYSISIIIFYDTVGALLGNVNFKQSLILYAHGSEGPFSGSWDQMHVKTIWIPWRNRIISSICWNTWRVYDTNLTFKSSFSALQEETCSWIISNMDFTEFGAYKKRAPLG